MRMPVTICGSMIAITVSMAAFNHPCRITLPASMSRNPLSVVGQGLCRPASPSGPRRRGRRRSDLDSPDEDETDRPTWILPQLRRGRRVLRVLIRVSPLPAVPVPGLSGTPDLHPNEAESGTSGHSLSPCWSRQNQWHRTFFAGYTFASLPPRSRFESCRGHHLISPV